MHEQGHLPVGRHQTCRELARDPHPHQSALERRLPAAPQGYFLAGDLLTVQHKGERVEGVGRVYSSSKRGMFWGHTFTSSALVAPGEDPYLLRCDPFPERRMATDAYPKLTPTEALLNVVGDVVVAGYELAGVLADAQFASKLSLRSLKFLKIPFVMRYRTINKVLFGDEVIKVRDLAARYPRGTARWYPKLGWYIKRLTVAIPELGEVDLLTIWKWQRSGWYLTALISTLEEGVQSVVGAWKARWPLEVSHRIRKQNLCLGLCSCRAFAAHLGHADLVIDAFNLVREERERSPGLTWRAAQRVAAERLGKAMVTGIEAIAA